MRERSFQMISREATIGPAAADRRGSQQYRVYVIELGRFHGIDARPAVYVGSTRHSARVRFREHLRGGFTASARVRRYGTRLLPELYRSEPSHSSRESAEAAEVRLAAELTRRGYRVFGASGQPMPRRSRAGMRGAARVGRPDRKVGPECRT